jgi:asparagine synthase (glutamine-hydrolysing)
MSILFGIRKPVRGLVATEELLTLASATQRFALDETFVETNGNIGMGFQPYYTHERSKLESQPVSDRFGNLVVFDGRLDNYRELSSELGMDNPNAADSVLVLASFERWGKRCFSRFTGDWALAISSRSDDALYLARDHAGTRSIYFQNANGTLRWATYLETFFASGERNSLDQQFVACYLSLQPIRDLTPYEGIRAVLPGHFLTVRNKTITQTPHWDWIAKGQIHYKSDREYEEHFLALFRQSVERRTGPGAPILAELSGGMDSTSIVCMSDHICLSQGGVVSDILDTISYYDPREPNWNEEPYFSITEARRGKKGTHIEISGAVRTFEPVDSALSGPKSLWPGTDSRSLEQEEEFHQTIRGRGYRTILSGIGGDEVLGGVPNPLPELADLLVSANLVNLFKQAKAWSLSSRSPLLHMLFRTVRFTMDQYRSPSRSEMTSLPPWVCQNSKDLKPARLRGPNRPHRIGSLPSALSNGQAWWDVQETLPHLWPGTIARYEYRYPYLDRDLVDFLYRVPREQLLRPGSRRSLMRRALRSIVPEEILMRRRKAYVVHGPLVALRSASDRIEALVHDSLAVTCGFVDKDNLLRCLHGVLGGQDLRQMHPLVNTLLFEIWLRATSNLRPHTEIRADVNSSAHTQVGVESAVKAD